VLCDTQTEGVQKV